MRRPRLVYVALLFSSAGFPARLLAQRTNDQARLIFTLSGGIVGGKRLWSVSSQPIQPTAGADTFALARTIRSTLAIGMSGTYFPGAHLGVMLEGFLIGLGYEDACHQVFSSGSSDIAAACVSIQGAEKPATAVMLNLGPVFRLNSQSLVSPYGRLSAGLVFSNQSALRTTGTFESPSGTALLPVYSDDHDSRVEPTLALGVGFTAAVARGYQLRWELRDNVVGVPRVTGPSVAAGPVPPNELEFKHLVSMTIGFDVVLERRRGRRY